MKFNPVLRKTTELGIGLTAIATLILAGCGGGYTAAITPATSTPLIITPSLGQLYRGQVVVTGSNGTTKSYSVASGVATVTADIAGMTAPLLIELKGDPSNGDQIIYFDEAQGTIASSVITASASAVRAVIPSITGISASGVGVTPLTNMAVATLADASGVFNFTNLSVASAVGANTAGLAMAQKLAGNTTITDVLSPATPTKTRGASLGSTAADEYAKVLHTLANLPASYGSDAFKKAEFLRATIASTGKPPTGFDADVGTANTTAAGGYTGTAPVPKPAFADFRAMMGIAAQAMPVSAVTGSASSSAQQAAMGAAMLDAFNATSGVSATGVVVADQAARNNAITAGQGHANIAAQAVLALPAGTTGNPQALQAAIQQALQSAASGLSAASAIANAQTAGALAAYAGTYTGAVNLNGTQTGTFSAVVDSAGAIRGSSNINGVTEAGSGQVASDNTFTFNGAKGDIFSGTINAATGTISGSCTNCVNKTTVTGTKL